MCPRADWLNPYLPGTLFFLIPRGFYGGPMRRRIAALLPVGVLLLAACSSNGGPQTVGQTREVGDQAEHERRLPRCLRADVGEEPEGPTNERHGAHVEHACAEIARPAHNDNDEKETDR